MSRSTPFTPPPNSTAESILGAARDLLDREGVAAVTMRRVAQQVGITPMAIYRHYPDRAAVLNAIADAGFAELAVRVRKLQLHGRVKRRLMQVSEVFLDTALEFPALYELMFLSRREGARIYPADFKARRSPTFNPTVEILEEAMRNGEVRRDDPVEIAFELSALSHGLIVLYLGGRVAEDKKEFRQLYERSFERYLHGIRK